MAQANLAESRVSAMYTEESIDEGRSLVDNLDGVVKKEIEEDDGMKLIEQMRSLISDCKIDLDKDKEVDTEKVQRL